MDVHRAESPHTGAAALDPRRAEAACKHVRALNTQFASWVQSQLQNHQDELWEDGVKDYLSHASEIMENFKDVVNWLRQNKTGTAAVSCPSPANDEKTTSPGTVNSKFMLQPGSDNGQKSLSTGASSLAFQNSSSPNMFSLSSQKKTATFGGIFDNKDTPGDSSKSTFQFGGNNGFSTPTNTPGDSSKSTFQFGGNNGFSTPTNTPGDSSKSTFQFGGNNGFSTPTTPSIFSTPGSSFNMPTPTLFSMNQQPIFTGSGSKRAAEASADADEDAEAEQPSSPSVKKAEEKGIVVVHEAKCKVYVKHDDATKGWKDIGVGQLSIRCKEGAEKASKESTPTVVIRNDVGKILLNAMIYKGIKMSVQKNTVASIFHTSDAQSESDGGNVVARTYLLRLKNEEAATSLSAVIKENTPLD